MMVFSEMMTTRQVANDLAGMYKWMQTMKKNLANVSRRQVCAEWRQIETLQIIVWLAKCTWSADNYKKTLRIVGHSPPSFLTDCHRPTLKRFHDKIKENPST
jgi:hypothetical protein